MPQQLTFDLPVRTAIGRDDFFVSDANAAAISQIDDWANWPDRKLLLLGPPCSGKTHLACVWAAQSGATIIPAPDLSTVDIPTLASNGPCLAVENAEQIAGVQEAEVALFHLHNLALAEGGSLLITAETAPNRWPLDLEDLKSRLLGTNTVELQAPDDALLMAILVKLFADRQLDVPGNVVSYLASHMDRSIKAAAELVEAIDTFSLAAKRPVTRSLAGQVLDNLHQSGA